MDDQVKLAFSLNGYEIYTDETLLVEERQEVPKTFVERFLRFPWRPWEKTYVVRLKVADPKLYMKENNKIYGHPYTVKQLSESIIAKINLRMSL